MLNYKESIRNFFRYLFLTVAGSISKPKAGIHIISSHFVSRTEPNYELFCDFLKFLKSFGDLVRFEETVDLITRKISPTNCLLSLTFDDGFEELFSIIAPALEEFNTNGAFYINGGFINGDDNYKKDFTSNTVKVFGKEPLTWLQIKSLNERGHIIGSHTLDHVDMNNKNNHYIDFQLRKNKQLIEKWTNKPCDYFAFPFGQLIHINNDTLKLAEKYHKYIFSATNNRYYFSVNDRIINRRHLESEWPRSHIKYFLSKSIKY